MRRLFSAFCIVLLVGCSRMAATSSLPATSQSASHVTRNTSGFQTLYVFEKAADGDVPVGNLLVVNGILYGTTNFGGIPHCRPGHGCGLVYTFSLPSTETVIYRFKGGSDIARPYAGMIELNGTLYGTTQSGGKKNDGGVFALTPSGSESVVYAFDGKHGADARAGLTSINDTLYGTTYYGGSAGTGTVFSTGPSGGEKVLHSFKGGKDGSLPLGTLIEVNGTLYGTTSAGGTNNSGTVFQINPNGSNYSVMHSFTGGADGASPFSGLLELNGTLYGTTRLGGKHNQGTVFSITTSGSETVLYNFAGKSDGAKPFSGLTNLNGVLYGTTSAGGGPHNYGTLYGITPSGSETVLHRFTGAAGGRNPYANLTVMNGVLYGTTLMGVRKGDSGGTIFEYAP
jgi:uncharacterized repeat protein (TIGR03803 family)